ncbi:CHAT domain-containing protein [Streptomyces sp. SID8354]|nr:CHAT domain-containing protein [Streptomyces sp. SID8354]
MLPLERAVPSYPRRPPPSPPPSARPPPRPAALAPRAARSWRYRRRQDSRPWPAPSPRPAPPPTATGPARPRHRCPATRARLLAVLPASTHDPFACHAVADASSPYGSHLIRHDPPLTVAEISRLRLPHGGFCYLSACTTAGSGRVPDEAVHIGGAFHLAGFGQVVATLWPVEAATEAARLFHTSPRPRPPRGHTHPPGEHPAAAGQMGGSPPHRAVGGGHAGVTRPSRGGCHRAEPRRREVPPGGGDRQPSRIGSAASRQLPGSGTRWRASGSTASATSG